MSEVSEQRTFWDAFWQGMFWGGVVGLPVFFAYVALRFL
jgi:hypothetical protein